MNHTELEYAVPELDEQSAMESVVAQALHFQTDYIHWWVEQIGLANFRVVRDRGRIVAGLGLIHMGQWFAGQRIGCAGITAVGVALDRRGHGVGNALMGYAMAELHAAGTPLSTLHPSSLRFYRAIGYERAGTRLTFEAPLHTFAARPSLEITPVAPAEYAALRPIYQTYAAATHGALDRAPFIWTRLLEPRGTAVTAFRIGGAAAPQGYVVLTQGGRDEPLRIQDLCMLTAEAGKAIQALVAGQRTMVDHIAWNGAPDDPLALMAEGRPPTITRMHDWMLRVVDVPKALAARGYAPVVSGALHLDVRDALLAQNRGRFILEVDRGRAEVRRGGEGRLRLDVRDLAALYSGHLPPATLRSSGTLAGDAESLALAAALFSTERPRMAEMF